jgi:hypothetical protein
MAMNQVCILLSGFNFVKSKKKFFETIRGVEE